MKVRVSFSLWLTSLLAAMTLSSSGTHCLANPSLPSDCLGGDGASGAWLNHKKVVLKFVRIAKDESDFLSDLEIELFDVELKAFASH